VTAEEIALAKAAIAQSLPGQFETNQATVGALSAIFVYGLPLDYYATLPAAIEAITAADVRAVATKYLVSDKLMVVAVGDAAAIRPTLETEIGPAQLRNAEGQVLPK
jgi:zinc protease